MSKRRNAGDVVWKRPNAGFCGQSGLGMIRPDSESDECLLECGDAGCREWPDVWPLGGDGKPMGGGNWCHVSECQMDDRA